RLSLRDLDLANGPALVLLTEQAAGLPRVPPERTQLPSVLAPVGPTAAELLLGDSQRGRIDRNSRSVRSGTPVQPDPDLMGARHDLGPRGARGAKDQATISLARPCIDPVKRGVGRTDDPHRAVAHADGVDRSGGGKPRPCLDASRGAFDAQQLVVVCAPTHDPDRTFADRDS